jgi:hypothetical protein
MIEARAGMRPVIGDAPKLHIGFRLAANATGRG